MKTVATQKKTDKQKPTLPGKPKLETYARPDIVAGTAFTGTPASGSPNDNISDRDRKENFRGVTERDVLAGVLDVPPRKLAKPTVGSFQGTDIMRDTAFTGTRSGSGQIVDSDRDIKRGRQPIAEQDVLNRVLDLPGKELPTPSLRSFDRTALLGNMAFTGDTRSGGQNLPSDRNIKRRREPVSDSDVLEGVLCLPAKRPVKPTVRSFRRDDITRSTAFTGRLSGSGPIDQSDRDAKRHFQPVCALWALERLLKI